MDINKKTYLEMNAALTESLVKSIKQLDEHITINTKLVEYIIMLHQEMHDLAERMSQKGNELFGEIIPIAERMEKESE